MLQKDVVAGIDENGNKVLMAPMERIEKISKGKAETVDISDVIVHKTIEADRFSRLFMHFIVSQKWHTNGIVISTV